MKVVLYKDMSSFVVETSVFLFGYGILFWFLLFGLWFVVFWGFLLLVFFVSALRKKKNSLGLTHKNNTNETANS